MFAMFSDDPRWMPLPFVFSFSATPMDKLSNENLLSPLFFFSMFPPIKVIYINPPHPTWWWYFCSFSFFFYVLFPLSASLVSPMPLLPLFLPEEFHVNLELFLPFQTDSPDFLETLLSPFPPVSFLRPKFTWLKSTFWHVELFICKPKPSHLEEGDLCHLSSPCASSDSLF